MKLCPAESRCTRPVLTERKAELLALEYKLEKADPTHSGVVLLDVGRVGITSSKFQALWSVIL